MHGCHFKFRGANGEPSPQPLFEHRGHVAYTGSTLQSETAAVVINSHACRRCGSLTGRNLSPPQTNLPQTFCKWVQRGLRRQKGAAGSVLFRGKRRGTCSTCGHCFEQRYMFLARKRRASGQSQRRRPLSAWFLRPAFCKPAGAWLAWLAWPCLFEAQAQSAQPGLDLNSSGPSAFSWPSPATYQLKVLCSGSVVWHLMLGWCLGKSLMTRRDLSAIASWHTAAQTGSGAFHGGYSAAL